MERYKCRDGVVLTHICGETLLVSARALREQCPFLTVLNDSSAFLWQRLKTGASAAELEEAVCREYEVDDPAEVRGLIETFLHRMNEYHYLVKMEQGEQNE